MMCLAGDVCEASLVFGMIVWPFMSLGWWLLTIQKMASVHRYKGPGTYITGGDIKGCKYWAGNRGSSKRKQDHRIQEFCLY